MKIKKGDNVTVISGASRGKSGKVLRVITKTEKVVIEGVNLRKKHQRARKEGQKGQIIETAYPIHVSNVKIST